MTGHRHQPQITREQARAVSAPVNDARPHARPSEPGRAAGLRRVRGTVTSHYLGAAPDGSWLAGGLAAVPRAAGTPGPVPVTFVASYVPGLEVGRQVVLEGTWDPHPTYGLQFCVDRCAESLRPTEERALVRYLAANIPGVRDARAAALVRVLGREAPATLLADPDCVRRIFPGAVGERVRLGVRRWRAATRAEVWSADLAPRLMAAAGVGYALARRIVAHFTTAEAAELVARRAPYRLLEVPGIGWARADAIARALGVAPDAPERADAAVLWALRTAEMRGHTALPVPRLVAAAAEVAPGAPAETRRAVVRLLAGGDLVRRRRLLYRPDALAAERRVAWLVAALAGARYALAGDAAARVAAVVRAAKLSAEQAGAVTQALTHGCAVLTGGPGTGKTHTLRAVVRAAEAVGLRVWLAAPTGRAAARMQALTGRPATTLHKLLGGAPGGVRTAGPIADGLVVLDEASMVDVATMAWLARNLRVRPGGSGLRLLLVGDACQLPAIGHGRVLADVLASGVVASTTLTAPRRQVAASRIVVQAHRLRDRRPLLTGDTHDWQVLSLPADAEAALRVVLATVRRVVHEERTSLVRAARLESAAFDPVRELQVLTPRRGGALGADALNPLLRDALNPVLGEAAALRAARGPWVGGGVRVRRRDRVGSVQNDYTVGDRGLMNGEQGMVEAIDGDAITLALDDGRRVVTRGVQNLNLALGFASTVHRAQGGEYPVVVAVLHPSHAPLADPSVLYTAITRARARLVLCAEPTTLARVEAAAAADGLLRDRSTGLADEIRSLRGRARRADRAAA